MAWRDRHRGARKRAEGFDSIEEADLGPWLDRVGDSQVVLLGEMTHGTSEFYRMRARMTEALVEQKGFNVVALEADWPDAARMDHYVRHRPAPPTTWTAFSRWPTWMWRNDEFRRFMDRLHARNAGLEEHERVALCGLDLYSMATSMGEVLTYLEEHDPELAEVARERYGCLARWEGDPAAYGAAVAQRLTNCEEPIVELLQTLLRERLDGEALFDAQQNARVVQGAERYYRSLYQGAVSSWNLRDQHMVETLEAVLDRRPDAKAVVWAHNSHVGDARASEMHEQGGTTLGTLCRERFKCHSTGFFTHSGTTLAADSWGETGRRMEVRPSRESSHGAMLDASCPPQALLPLQGLKEDLRANRLERAIGVVYRPQTEAHSHHFGSVLPERYDEVAWFRETNAVRPLVTEELPEAPDTYPFAV